VPVYKVRVGAHFSSKDAQAIGVFLDLLTRDITDDDELQNKHSCT